MGLLQSAFFTGLTFLSTLTSVNSSSFISMNNQECKVRPQIINVNSEEPVFFLVLKQVNAVVVVTISIIHMQNRVPLMLVKN